MVQPQPLQAHPRFSHSLVRAWNGANISGWVSRVGWAKGLSPCPSGSLSRIYGKDLGQDGPAMNTLRFAHPTGLLPGEWRFSPDRSVPRRRKRWRVGGRSRFPLPSACRPCRGWAQAMGPIAPPGRLDPAGSWASDLRYWFVLPYSCQGH
jgi:hypothetical protein